MHSAFLVYPHQLFESLLTQKHAQTILLAEEPLLFTQFHFHKKKLVLHRASMKAFADRLMKAGFRVVYLDCEALAETHSIASQLRKLGFDTVHLFDVTDNWLSKRLAHAFSKERITLITHDTPGFYLTSQDIEQEFGNRSSFAMASFYVKQRKRFKVLVEQGKPIGGQWSFDSENRKKIPKGVHLPSLPRLNENPFVKEAILYVNSRFKISYGSTDNFCYPVTHQEAKAWLDDFLENKLADFGAYQDAISRQNSFLFHSVLSPSLNIGLITPREVVDSVLAWSVKHPIPLNSLEGFIRQILGWREYVRGVYCQVGGRERTKNFWGHTRSIPQSFWQGTTGIGPVDDVIQKALTNAYAHHIERLMVMANFMMLCEFHPDDVYRWFMELFIDAYDWVMVPNVYGMGQYADGGMITTKPYLSGSNYILKMSDYTKGEWCEIWNSLYWTFVDKHLDFFQQNLRTKPIAMLLNKMDPKIRIKHRQVAERYLDSL